MPGVHEGYSGQGKRVGSQETRTRLRDLEAAPRHCRLSQQEPPTSLPSLETEIVATVERFGVEEAHRINRSGTGVLKAATIVKEKGERDAEPDDKGAEIKLEGRECVKLEEESINNLKAELFLELGTKIPR